MTKKPDDEAARSDQQVAVFHTGHLTLSTAALIAPLDLPTGWVLLASVVLYNLALPILAARWVQPLWIRIWSFLLPLSLLQVLPDGFLATTLGTIVFPDMGVAQVLGVSAFMALMWIIPLFLVVYVGERVSETRSEAEARIWVAVSAFLLFVGSEAVLTQIPIWHAQNVATVGPVALYVVIPEILLGLAAFAAWRRVGRNPESTAVERLVTAFAVSLFYTGALALSHLLIDGGGLAG